MRFDLNIQGMRALAVLAVLITHLNANWLPGGFVGVDVFFVISGYLVTGLLLKEYGKNGKIGFVAFYQRRIRRLFPAMLVTCVFTLAGGFLLFSDERFYLLLDSTLAAMFSLSNFYFWSQVGYFDTESSVKPLLHTWSLGVEEQFYLIWPLLIVAFLSLFKLKRLVLSLVLLCLASYFLNYLFITKGIGDVIGKSEGVLSGFLDGGSTAFYLMPFRIFEFGIGAILYIVKPRLDGVSGAVSDVVAACSLVGLLLFMVGLTGESVFPYYNALAVSVLTALIIAFSDKAKFTGQVLSNRFMVFIGGISYSLYLVHWPMIVYYDNVFGQFDVFSAVVFVIFVFAFGYALHIFVEQRYRYAYIPERSKSRLASSVARGRLPLAMLFTASLVLALYGMEDRVPEHRLVKSNAEWRKIEKEKYCGDSMEEFPKAIFSCQKDRGSDKTVVIWGDSHALHLVAGVAGAFPGHNVAVAYLDGCISQSGYNGLVRGFSSQYLTDQCVERNHQFMGWAEAYKGDLTILISNAKRNDPIQISEINNWHIKKLGQFDHKAFVMGDFIRPGVELAQCFSVPDYVLNDTVLRSRCAFDRKQVAQELEYSERLASLSNSYIPVHDIQCPASDCRFSDEAGQVSFRDTHHLSVPGSVYWISKVVNENQLFSPESIFVPSNGVDSR